MPNKLDQRYSDAYKAARKLIVLAKVLRAICFVLGAAFFISGLFETSQGYWTFALIGVTSGLFVMLLAMGIYTLLVARVQVMIAIVDTAINTSPLITAEDKSLMIEALM